MKRHEETRGRYTFGDGDAAERRLEHIASFFNVSAESFLRLHVTRPAEIAVDIGCGPGYTTQMLGRSVTAARVVGFDISEDFLRRAAARLPRCEFMRHDIRNTPFPVAPDLAYCRFVLTHIPNAPALVDRWIQALAPGGWLVLDELEGIETDVSLFQRYLEINTGLVASQGGNMYVGAALQAASCKAHVVLSEAARLAVPNRMAASWFHPNSMTIWKREPYVLAHVDETEQEAVSRSLAHIRDTDEPRGHATWIMRRMILGNSKGATGKRLGAKLTTDSPSI
jgi:trans-aconitate 2-methyltransferase